MKEVVEQTATSAKAESALIESTGYRRIEDYAMVGNGVSAALIASDGAVDWLCLPEFDSPAVLCRILDVHRGGYFTTLPTDRHDVVGHKYRPDSMILETRLATESTTLTLTDLMPTDSFSSAGDPDDRNDSCFVRLLSTDGASIEVQFTARLAFDFGATPLQFVFEPGIGALATDNGERWLVIVWPGELHINESGELTGSHMVTAEEQSVLALAYYNNGTVAHQVLTLPPSYWLEFAGITERTWRDWSGDLAISGPYREVMLRSALTLKAMACVDTGAIIAAPTTSLPEAISGARNWDYRYCWLRDATFTLYALLLIDDTETAQAFWQWIEHTCAHAAPADLQIMYTIRGEKEIPEKVLDHLEGYARSRPVRVGNAASTQRQLDVYGELLDALWFYYHHGQVNGDPPPISPAVLDLAMEIADYICDIWRQPDQGLWETRSGPRHYVYSKVMCWVGLDRAVALAQAMRLNHDSARWEQERDLIRAEVLEKGFHPSVNAFTMHYHTDDMDAANLRLPLVGFLPATDPRMVSTIDRIWDELGDNHGLIRRYLLHGDDTDGFADREGSFSICSFWLVDCLTAMGRIQDAKTLFDKLLGYASDLGLFAEQIASGSGEARGNYPQAFTHLALIDACVDLTEALTRHQPVAGTALERAEQVRKPAADGQHRPSHKHQIWKSKARQHGQ